MINWLVTAFPLSYSDAVVLIGTATLGFVAGALGPFTVLRQRSMFGDAVSHGTLPGVLLAFILTGTKIPELLLLGGAISAIIAALAMVGLERIGRLQPDAAIGVTLSAALTLGLVLLTHTASTGNSSQSGLNSYLLGQVAGMVERDIITTLIVGGITLAAVVVFFRALQTANFDPSFSTVAGLSTRVMDLASTGLLVTAVVLGVRTVGAILMIALLTAPTIAARQLTKRLSTLVPLAGLVGAVAGVGGGLLSTAAELPTGPVIVLLATIAAMCSLVFAPHRGVLNQVRLRRKKALA